MTEAEAKTKWCPLAFAVKAGGYATMNGSHCIGSACMMWRWKAGPMRTEDIEHGYCGLAGK